MTHRDDVMAQRERIEAQAREIDEQKSEIELLRAAHAQKTRQVEELRRELDRLRSERPLGERIGLQDAIAHRRAFGAAAAVIAGSAMLAAMLGVAAAGTPCHSRARAVAATPRAVGSHFGHVVQADGQVVSTGEACTVEVAHVGGGMLDCRVEVRCGERVLYGASPEVGYAACGARSVVRDRHFTARDGDPAMTLDLDAHRVVVEEQLGLGTQRVEIVLVDPAVAAPRE